MINGKGNAVPNPGACLHTLSIEPGALDPCTERNLYMWQLTKAGFLSLPVPSAVGLAKLTWQVAENNNFPATAGHQNDDAMMAFLRSRIKHVIDIVGPYLKQGAVVSTAYNTVSMIRTIEDVLGLEPLGLTYGLAAPMTEVFEETLRPWTYASAVPEVLPTTELPLPPRTASNSLPLTDAVLAFATPRHNAAYRQKAIGWQNFTAEDKLDPKRFNEALWQGLMGEDTPYPEMRHGRDLSRARGDCCKHTTKR